MTDIFVTYTQKPMGNKNKTLFNNSAKEFGIALEEKWHPLQSQYSGEELLRLSLSLTTNSLCTFNRNYNLQLKLLFQFKICHEESQT